MVVVMTCFCRFVGGGVSVRTLVGLDSLLTFSWKESDEEDDAILKWRLVDASEVEAIEESLAEDTRLMVKIR